MKGFWELRTCMYITFPRASDSHNYMSQLIFVQKYDLQHMHVVQLDVG